MSEPTWYTIRIDTNDRLPVSGSAMQWLADGVASHLESLGLDENGDFAIEVKGPPELSIGVVMR